MRCQTDCGVRCHDCGTHPKVVHACTLERVLVRLGLPVDPLPVFCEACWHARFDRVFVAGQL